MPSAVLAAIPFRDRALARRSLTSLHEAFITSGSLFPADAFVRPLERLLAGSPDPDLALTNFVRFIEATFSRSSLFNDLVRYPAFFELLIRLCGFSRYLADILVREPELFRWLTASDAMTRPVERSELAEEFRRLGETFARPERLMDAIKRVHRRAILRIGAQDIMGTADLVSVTAQLSDLADAVTDAVLEAAHRQLRERYGEPPRARFAVLALGKHGGRELNFSSDIDVLFVYDEEGMVADRRGGESSHHEYFNRLAELLVQGLTQPTAEGHLYRVDTRLRPESGAGPLARSLRSYLIYYEARGELWERQMLIKARPAAGDDGLGREFIAQLQPFIFPRTFFQHPADAVARIKARIEARIGDERNIKLRAGGIRDIEFIVQVLQLLHGGRRRHLREPNTLRAVGALAADGLLTEAEAAMLTGAYTFYRTLEHRLQIMANTQTHTVPDDQPTLASLARRLGLAGAPALNAMLQARLREVRRLFKQVMSMHGAGAEGGIGALIDGSLGDDQAAEVLASYGLTDHRAAARTVRTLTGISLTGQQEMDARTRAALRAVAPDLFREIGATPDPDLTLRDLGLLAGAQAAPRQLYDALTEPRFRRLLLDIASVSPRLTRGLASAPLLLDAVITDIGSLAAGGLLELPRTGELTEFKTHQELRAALRYVLGFATLVELTGELSMLAEFIVKAALERETRGVRSFPVAVFALGKFGTREMGFDADLDLLFVSGAAPAGRRAALEQAASSLVRQLSAVSDKGRLYEVDARLRPEGRNAPLVTGVKTYAEYLKRRASLWERQSLTRARFVAGDPATGSQFAELAAGFVFGTPLPAGWVGQTAGMRRKMETRSRTRGDALLDIKLGPGGLADIEFIVQMSQLAYGPREERLRFGSTPALLADLPGIPADERKFLLDSYLWYRKIETLLRLTLEERSTLLPEEGKLRTLARVAERAEGKSFRADAAARMKAVRTMFDAFCRRMDHP